MSNEKSEMSNEERRVDFGKRYDAFVLANSDFCKKLRELLEEKQEIEDYVLSEIAKEYLEDKERRQI